MGGKKKSKKNVSAPDEHISVNPNKMEMEDFKGSAENLLGSKGKSAKIQNKDFNLEYLSSETKGNLDPMAKEFVCTNESYRVSSKCDKKTVSACETKNWGSTEEEKVESKTATIVSESRNVRNSESPQKTQHTGRLQDNRYRGFKQNPLNDDKSRGNASKREYKCGANFDSTKERANECSVNTSIKNTKEEEEEDWESNADIASKSPESNWECAIQPSTSVNDNLDSFSSMNTFDSSDDPFFNNSKTLDSTGKSHFNNSWSNSSKNNDSYSSKKSWDGNVSGKNYKSESAVFDYGDFEKLLRRKDEINHGKLHEIAGDLFTAPKDYSLAHCVAEDMRMGSGIAVKFKQEFYDIGDLLNQRQRQGGCAFINRKDRYVYYLVTKKISTGKPTNETLWKSLLKMKKLMLEHTVTKLAIPRIGCGLDRLEWNHVKQMLEYIFQDVDVDITVYNIQMDSSAVSSTTQSGPSQRKVRSTEIRHERYPLNEMNSRGAILIYFATEDGKHFPEAVDVFQKFALQQPFREADKTVGNVIRTENSFHNCILYGFVVKKTLKDRFDYKHFENCVKIVQKRNRKDGYEYVGIEAFKDGEDDTFMDKITNVLMDALSQVYVYVCWPKDLQFLMPQQR